MARFITSYDITSNSAVQANVQASLLEPYIDLCQQMYILRLLSTQVYDPFEATIITAMTSNGHVTTSATTAVNQALLTVLKPALIFATFYECFPFLEVKVTNKGITIKSSETTTEPDDKRKDILRKSINNWKEFYLEEAKRFLRKNKTSNYPNWTEDYFYSNELLSGQTCSNSTNYDGGLYIPDTGSNYRKRYGYYL